MTMEIRRATESDINFIATLESECFSLPQSHADLAAMVNDSTKTLLVALLDGEYAGYIGAYTVCRESDIMTVAAIPRFRKMGVGRALVNALFDELRGKSDALFLEVRKSNGAAISLYTSLGFENIGVRKNYYKLPTEDALLYKKDL